MLGQLQINIDKIYVDLYKRSTQKINSRWMVGLNVKRKTTKHIRDNTGDCHHILGIDKFLTRDATKQNKTIKPKVKGG